MSDYPLQYDSFVELVDNVHDIRAGDVNALSSAVYQIQQTLGINVNGANQVTGWTLANRLRRSINEDGTLKPDAFNPTLIPVNTIDPTKIYADTTWAFQKVQAGKNDNGTYGYTGQGPGVNAGVTLDDDGVVYSDGGFVTQGYIQTNGLLSTTQHIFGAPVNVQSDVFLGASSASVIEWTGILRPSVTVSYDLGDPTHRINNLYAQNIIGAQAGGTTLVVSASASFGTGTQIFNIITTGLAPTGSPTQSYLYSDGSNITISGSSTGSINFDSPILYKGVPLYSSEGFSNWVENSKFDKWASGPSALPNMWLVQGSLASITRESTTVKYKPYAATVVTSAVNSGLSQVLTNDSTGQLPLDLVLGEPCYFFADVYCATAGEVFLQLNDGFTLFNSDYLSVTGSYQRLAIQTDLSGTANTVQVRVLAASSGVTFKVGAVGFYQGQLPKAWTPHVIDLAGYYA